MLLIQQALLYGHIVAGALALLIFWAPLLAKKGSPWHRQSGRYYSYLLQGIGLSGMLLSLANIVNPLYFKGHLLRVGQDPIQFAENIRQMASFLGLLSLLSWVNVRQATLVLKAGFERQALRHWTHQLALLALLVLSPLVIYQGVMHNLTLSMVFGAIGLFSAIGALRYNWRPEVNKALLLREHIGNILGSGIAVYTAFFALGGRRFLQLSQQGQLISWILPSVIGVAAMYWFYRRYAPLPKRQSAAATTTYL